MKWRPLRRFEQTSRETVKEWMKQAIPVKRSRGFILSGTWPGLCTEYGQADAVKPFQREYARKFLEAIGMWEAVLGWDAYTGGGEHKKGAFGIDNPFYVLDADWDDELAENPKSYWDKWLDALILTFSDFYESRLERGKP